MHLTILLYFLLAHFLSDFIFQSNKIAETRYSVVTKKRIKANIKHTLIHFATAFICIINYLSFEIVLFLLLLSFSHLVIDLSKAKIIVSKPRFKYSPWIFIIDQILHIFCIVIISYWSGFYTGKWHIISSFAKHIESIIHTFNTTRTYQMNLLITILLLVIGLWGVGIFIRIFLENLRQKSQSSHISGENINIDNPKPDGALDGGFIIGILERLFIIIAMILDIPDVIGFVLTAKSIARLKKFNDDSFVEEFIIGSFISFISAIAIGIIIKSLNVIPLLIKL